MLSKEQIIFNRNRIRNQMKVCLVTPKIQGKHHQKLDENESPLEIRLKKKENQKKNRKRSEDLSIFQNANKVKQLYISENFFDLFQLHEKLGEGAQSVVKKCKQKVSGKVFAVKIFRKSDKELIETLKTQYTILKTLDHASIVHANYLFVNEKQQNCQLVMQYSSLPQLAIVLERQKRFSEYKTSQIITNLLLAVSYMHEKSICHRDIKPQNILYDEYTNQIKLIDFQIAKMKTKFERLQMWSKTGTIYYKAPEMFFGKYNQLVDVWAIGILTYQLLTGQVPFSKEYINQTIQMITTTQPQFPSDMSNFAKDFIRRCLIKNPLKRITAKEALSSPFLLQYDSKSSAQSNTKGDKLNFSFQQKMTEQSGEIEQINQKFVINRCFLQDQISQDSVLNTDIGIRHCNRQF